MEDVCSDIVTAKASNFGKDFVNFLVLGRSLIGGELGQIVAKPLNFDTLYLDVKGIAAESDWRRRIEQVVSVLRVGRKFGKSVFDGGDLAFRNEVAFERSVANAGVGLNGGDDVKNLVRHLLEPVYA
jgi:hypothetical protein